MKETIQRTIRRFRQSAFTSGAMPRFFICVGNQEYEKSVLDGLAEEGFEIIKGNLNVIGIFPWDYLQHQGTHFNRKLFVLEGIDDIAQKLGNEFFRRLETERRQFTRTATWTLIWVRGLETAEHFRKLAPGVWNLADDRAVFLEKEMIEKISITPSEGFQIHLSSLGEIKIPLSVVQKSLDQALQEPFWGDVLRLSPQEALLSFGELILKKTKVPPEIVSAIRVITEDRENIPLGEPILPDTKKDTWATVGEKVLAEVDTLFQGGMQEEALGKLHPLVEEWIGKQAYLLVDRPIRLRAVLRRAVGKISEAQADLDLWEKIAQASGLQSVITAALEAKASHAEEMGDRLQAVRIRERKKIYSGL